MKNNIILIGMPGVGKSTVGVILAKVLGYDFLDSDLLIQQQEGCLLREIIERQGMDGFIEVENRVNSGIKTTNTIIATGGSAVYGMEAMQHLKSIGTVVYLDISYEVLTQRLKDIKGRGVVLREGQDLQALFTERTQLYRKYADIVVEVTHLGIEETIQKIVDKLNFLNNIDGKNE